MIMKRSEKIAPFLKLTQYQEKMLAARFGDKQTQLKDFQQKLKLMEEYRSEYINHLYSDEAITVNHLSERHAFVQQINQTIELLKKQIKQIQPEYDAQKTSWLQSRQMMKSVETIVDRAKIKEQQKEQQKEQMLIDDMHNPIKNN